MPDISEERLRALVEHSADDSIVIDAEGVLLDVLPSAEGMSALGYTGSDVIGQSIFHFVHPDDLANVRAIRDLIVKQSDMSVTARFRCRHADGSWRYIEAVSTNRLDVDSVRGIVVNYHDVTTEKRAEDRQAILIGALSDLGVGIVILEGDRVRFANDAFCRMSGFPEAELKEQASAFAMLKPADREVLRKRLREHIEGAVVRNRHELTFTRRDGTTVELEIAFRTAPGGDRNQMIAIVQDITERKRQERERLRERDSRIASLQSDVRQLRREVGRKYQFENLIGNSAAMRHVYRLMEDAIESRLTVLITGETGTGKELVAKAIHYHSPRGQKPPVEVNCGAISPELVASALFGHRKGAFTGAFDDVPGLFEVASGGTILLDEIGEMPMDAQRYLLRTLEERTVVRLGESAPRPVDARVIAMTNRDLEKEVEANRFRADLFYRLNVFTIEIPPLRERPEDISPLTDYFLDEARRESGNQELALSNEAREAFAAYDWRGNIRELRNEIQRAVALARGFSVLRLEHFSKRVAKNRVEAPESGVERVPYAEAVERFKRQYVETALRETANHTQAAKILGMERTNLVGLIRRLGIRPDNGAGSPSDAAPRD